jgi:hypothetical protein
MSSPPEHVTTPDGHFLAVEPDEQDRTAVYFRTDFVEHVAVLRPAEDDRGERTDGHILWQLEFETAYYYPSVTLAGPPNEPPVNDDLPYLDQAIEDA